MKLIGWLTVALFLSPLLVQASAPDMECRAGMNQTPIRLEKSPAGFFLIAMEDPNFKKIDVVVDPHPEDKKARVYLCDFATKTTLNIWTSAIGKEQIVQLTIPQSGKDIWVSCEFGASEKRR